MGKTVEPVFKPLGWDWRIGVVAGSAGKLGTVIDLVRAQVERAAALRGEPFEPGIGLFRLFGVGGEEVLRLGRGANARIKAPITSRKIRIFVLRGRPDSTTLWEC
jgi:hypothetical protein